MSIPTLLLHHKHLLKNFHRLLSPQNKAKTTLSVAFRTLQCWLRNLLQVYLLKATWTLESTGGLFRYTTSMTIQPHPYFSLTVRGVIPDSLSLLLFVFVRFFFYFLKLLHDSHVLS